MPHAGGGGGSTGGGFHSGGSSSSTPRFDSYGNQHSNYYIRPGYYYMGMYVPYNRKGRMKNAVSTPIILFVVAFVFLIISIATFFGRPHYDQGKLEDYGIEKYEEVYKAKSKSYENNLMIMIVVYEDAMSYDYITIVGDNVDPSIDRMFGNEKSVFGEQLYESLNPNNGLSDLFSAIGSSLEYTTSKITNPTYYNGNDQSSKIKNESFLITFDDQSFFTTAEEDFYNTTGYHVSIFITDTDHCYNDTVGAIVCLGVFFIFGGLALWLLLRSVKAVKAINNAEDNNEDYKFYEGEVKYEEFVMNNPKDFEIDKDDYTV